LEGTTAFDVYDIGKNLTLKDRIARCESIGITEVQLDEFHEFIKSFPQSELRDVDHKVRDLSFHEWADFFDSVGIDAHVSGILVLKHEKPAPQKVLYVACAHGIGMKLLQSLGYKVYGIDNDHRYIAEANERGIKAHRMNATQLLLPDDKFDVTISRHFLCFDYLNPEQLETALMEQWRVLREGGILINYSQLDSRFGGKDNRLSEDIAKKTQFRKLRKYTIQLYDLIRKDRYTKHVDVLEK